MMLVGGRYPVTDHSGRPVSGVNTLFDRIINFSLATYNQRFTTPADAVGKSGYLVSRVTILEDCAASVGACLDIGRGIGGDGAASKDIDILLRKSGYKAGGVYDTAFSLASIPSFFRYFEFTETNSDTDTSLKCRVELKLYY